MKKDQSCNIPRWSLLKAQINNLTPVEFRAKLDIATEEIVLDVRTPNEFRHSAIPNAINLNYLGDDFIENLQKLDKNKTYFIYCRTGRRSVRVCTLMRNGGIDKNRIYNLDGGLVAWQETFTQKTKTN